MAKYWVGGTGNTNDPTNHWATTSGGAPGAGNAPTAADDVYFDANSGAGTVTINAALACRSIQSAGSSIATLVHNAATMVTVGDGTAGAGNIAVDLSGFTTYTLGNALTSAFTFASTSGTQQDINFNGKTVGDQTFSGTGGSWRYTAGWTSSATSRITQSRGTLDFNGQTISLGLMLQTSTNVRTLTLGASVITMTGTGGNVWNCTTSANFTLNGGTSSITCTGASPTFNGGAKTYYDVSFTGSTTASLNNSNSFHNLSRIGTAATGNSLVLGFGATQTVSNLLTLTGNSVPNHLFVATSLVTSNTTINAASATLTNVYFQDTTLGGAGAPFSGTSVGDCGSNSGITFTTPVTRYRVAGTNYNNTATWAASSGGAPGASIPLPQDTAIFDANSGVGTTTINMVRVSGIDASASSACTIQFNTATSVFGDLILGGSASITGTSSVSMGARSNKNFTTGGKTIPFPLTIVCYGATCTFTDTLTSTNSIAHGGGTLDLNNQDATFTAYSSTNILSLARTLLFGSGSINLTGTGSIWNIATPSGYTCTPGTGEIISSAVSATNRLFTGGGKTYPKLTYNVAGSTGRLEIVDTGNSFDAIEYSDASNAREFWFTAGITVTINDGANFDVNGSSAGNMTLKTNSAGSAATLAITTGQVSCNYLSVQDNSASGSVPAYCGPNGSLISNTSNWVATAPPSGDMLLAF